MKSRAPATSASGGAAEHHFVSGEFAFVEGLSET